MKRNTTQKLPLLNDSQFSFPNETFVFFYIFDILRVPFLAYLIWNVNRNLELDGVVGIGTFVLLAHFHFSIRLGQTWLFPHGLHSYRHYYFTSESYRVKRGCFWKVQKKQCSSIWVNCVKEMLSGILSFVIVQSQPL